MGSSKALRASALLVSSALLAVTVACIPGDDKPPANVGPQGWTDKQQSDWYEGTQGSRLLPWSWMQALEQPGNDRPFLDDAHMVSFRFLPRTDSHGRRIPIGFAIDRQNADGFRTGLPWYQGMKSGEEDWVGLNCSACHTAQMQAGGKIVRVDGAPSLVDFQLFVETLDEALVATNSDPAKWERFAAKVLTGKDNPANRQMLKAALANVIAFEEENQRLNKSDVRPGFARLDAVGHIYNKVSQIVGAENQNPNPSDAPVSYPYIWDIYRQSRLQYDGIAAPARTKEIDGRFLDYGALGRNAGEVIGVFGDVKVEDGGLLKGFPSLIQVESLDSLEETLRRLKSPKWPAAWTAPDAAKVDEGRRLFNEVTFDGKSKCVDCHIHPPETGDAIYKVTMVKQTRDNVNNTDPKMACNALAYEAKTGNLAGRPVSYIPNMKDNEKFGDRGALTDMLTTVVKGALVAKVAEIAETTFRIYTDRQRPPKVIGRLELDPTPEQRWQNQLNECFADTSGLFQYKGKPLNGIWATAPYLHNGSVPTLWDLLLAPAQRPKTFQVGTREYDVVRGGYVTAPSAIGNTFTFDTSIRGNSAMGHDYGVGNLTDAQRAALVEYMKTL